MLVANSADKSYFVKFPTAVHRRSSIDLAAHVGFRPLNFYLNFFCVYYGTEKMGTVSVVCAHTQPLT